MSTTYSTDLSLQPSYNLLVAAFSPPFHGFLTLMCMLKTMTAKKDETFSSLVTQTLFLLKGNTNKTAS